MLQATWRVRRFQSKVRYIILPDMARVQLGWAGHVPSKYQTDGMLSESCSLPAMHVPDCCCPQRSPH